MMITPPETKAELGARVDALCGKTLIEVASSLGGGVPTSLLRKKGWVGQMVEKVLGADAGSAPKPDFDHLAIELKTLPLGDNGKPKESTFVASIDLLAICHESFEQSLVFRKLSHVLWLPLEGSHRIPLAERRFGQGFFWQPSEHEMALLSRDWSELVEMIVLGQLELIDARLGQVLQIRPKAANAKSLCLALSADGEMYHTLPRGFYLRPSFTASLLRFA